MLEMTTYTVVIGQEKQVLEEILASYNSAKITHRNRLLQGGNLELLFYIRSIQYYL